MDSANADFALPMRSPLWMVTREPVLNQFVSYLTGFVEGLRQDPHHKHELSLSLAELSDVRKAFGAMIIRGEARLHQLSSLLCHTLFTNYKLSSVVVGEVEQSKERFILTQSLSHDDLLHTSDIDLGNRQISKLRFLSKDSWMSASLVANFVEYQPLEPNAFGVHKVISRIKAEEEIWNKVADEIFDLDGMVKRDKQISHLSYFVKDVFGLKMVVGSSQDVAKLKEWLANISWSPSDLDLVEREGFTRSTERLLILEEKDYLAEATQKQSGWSALKLVVSWMDKTFEIQIQSLRNYLSEQEFLTKESHAGFKARRESLREGIAEREPLYGYFRALLFWMFMGGNSVALAPKHPQVALKIRD